jgi:hypothetical protein
MSLIGGKKKEQQQFTESAKRVGLFEANVIAINPDAEEYKKILDIELKEDSNATDYLGETENGNKRLRIDVWLEEVKSKNRYKVSFWLKEEERVKTDKTKKQFINGIGSCSWAVDENDLPDWFKEKGVRAAYSGEEELYKFLRTWLGNLDYRHADTTLQLDWKKMMKGNTKDLKDQINGEWCTTVVAMATVKTSKEDGNKMYQKVYNGGFLPAYTLKQFRLLDYNKPEVINSFKDKKPKELKPYEKFVLDVIGQYGCRDYYSFSELKDYNPEDNLVASDKAISSDGDDF